METRFHFNPSSCSPGAHSRKERWFEWFSSITTIRRIVDRLGVTELRRRLFHMSPAFVAMALPLIPDRTHWDHFVAGVLVVCILSVTCAVRCRKSLKRRGETTWSHAVVGYLIPVAAPLLLFPKRPELGLATLQIIAFGDGSATFGGMMLRGRRLPWNPCKTVAGLLCFVACGSVAATYSYWGEVADLPLVSTFTICGIATICAAIIESLPIRSNDNFRVGVTALFAVIGMSLLVR